MVGRRPMALILRVTKATMGQKGIPMAMDYPTLRSKQLGQARFWLIQMAMAMEMRSRLIPESS